jgi:hypothetical protein
MLWIFTTRQVKAFDPKEFSGSFTWCYLGKDSRARRKIAKTLHPHPEADIADDLNAIAAELRQPFVDWIARLGQQQTDPLRWWASRLSARSPLQTDFFLLVCYRVACHSWHKDPSTSINRIIVIEDPWLHRLLNADFSGQDSVRSSGDPVLWLLAYGRWTLRRFLSRLRFLSAAFRALHFTHRFQGGTKNSQASGKTPDRPVLLYTELHASCFSEPGALHDFNTGRLKSILTENGLRVQHLIPLTISNPSLWNQLLPFRDEILLSSCSLSWKDIWKALRCRFTMTWNNTQSRFQDLDFKKLLQREMLLENAAPQYAHNYLLFVSLKRFALEHADAFECIIYPYENQPWEKMLCLAFKNSSSTTRLVGYQNATIPQNL